MTSVHSSAILVTGGLGFVGRYVARHFRSRKYRVIGVGHGEADAEAGLSRWQSGDVVGEALAALAEPIELIVHCAGSGLVGASFRDPGAEYRKSVGAAVEVLDFACRQAVRPRIVMLSSAAVYGVAEHLPIREDAPLNRISPYGNSKLVIEQRCRRAGREDGLEIAIVRLFSIYGPGLRKQLFWDACRKLSAGDGRFGGSGNERRDWLHVEDAVRLIYTAGQYASKTVPIINGGSGTSIRVSDALAQLRVLLPTPTPEISFTGEAREGDPAGYEADITRARSLGWAPRLDFTEGLAAYVAWARSVIG